MKKRGKNTKPSRKRQVKITQQSMDRILYNKQLGRFVVVFSFHHTKEKRQVFPNWLVANDVELFRLGSGSVGSSFFIIKNLDCVQSRKNCSQ